MAANYFDLTADQIAFRDAVRAYVREYVAPRADETDRLSRFPEQAVARAAQLGFLGLLVPHAYGGRGTGHLAFAIFGSRAVARRRGAAGRYRPVVGIDGPLEFVVGYRI